MSVSEIRDWHSSLRTAPGFHFVHPGYKMLRNACAVTPPRAPAERDPPPPGEGEKRSVLAARQRPSFARRRTKNSGTDPVGWPPEVVPAPSRSRARLIKIRKAKRRQTRNLPSASADAAARLISFASRACERAGRGALACRRSTAALAAANQRRRSAPARASWDAAFAGVSCISPVPVQRASRGPVMVPAGRFAEAARERR
jgi:hypothetical protein